MYQLLRIGFQILIIASLNIIVHSRNMAIDFNLKSTLVDALVQSGIQDYAVDFLASRYRLEYVPVALESTVVSGASVKQYMGDRGIDGAQGLVYACGDQHDQWLGLIEACNITEVFELILRLWKLSGENVLELSGGRSVEKIRDWFSAVYSYRNSGGNPAHYKRTKAAEAMEQRHAVLDCARGLAQVFGFLTPEFTSACSALAADSPVVHNLPEPNYKGLFGDYVGRKSEVKTVTNAVEGQQKLICIHGLGGIGKTALVQKVCSEYSVIRGEHFTHILWLTAKESELLVDRLQSTGWSADDIMLQMYAGVWAILNCEGVGEVDVKEAMETFGDDMVELREYCMVALNDPNSRWLLVVDNYESIFKMERLELEGEWSEMTKFLNDQMYLLGGVNKVVLTSREQFNGAFNIRVNALKENDAVSMLRTGAKNLRDTGMIGQAYYDELRHIDYLGIAKKMSFYPLWVAHIVGWMSKGGVVGQLLEEMVDSADRERFAFDSSLGQLSLASRVMLWVANWCRSNSVQLNVEVLDWLTPYQQVEGLRDGVLEAEQLGCLVVGPTGSVELAPRVDVYLKKVDEVFFEGVEVRRLTRICDDHLSVGRVDMKEVSLERSTDLSDFIKLNRNFELLCQLKAEDDKRVRKYLDIIISSQRANQRMSSAKGVLALSLHRYGDQSREQRDLIHRLAKEYWFSNDYIRTIDNNKDWDVIWRKSGFNVPKSFFKMRKINEDWRRNKNVWHLNYLQAWAKLLSGHSKVELLDFGTEDLVEELSAMSLIAAVLKEVECCDLPWKYEVFKDLRMLLDDLSAARSEWVDDLDEFDELLDAFRSDNIWDK